MSEDDNGILESVSTGMSQPMKALQIIQTVMLFALLTVGVWIGHTTVESSNKIAEMSQKLEGMSTEQRRVSEALDRLRDDHYALEHRVTTIEARMKP